MAPRILIVEDEPLVAMELKETLEAAGFEVPVTLDSVDDVLQEVHGHEPSLVLMDIRLKSFLDGIDAATRLRFFDQTPIIYLTAYSTPDVVKRAEGTHPTAFLVKPVDGPLLIRTIQGALDLPRTAV